jgi:hypothetical protein
MIFNTLSSPMAGLNLGTPNLSASNASSPNPALNALGLNTNALALPTPNAGNSLFNLGATQATSPSVSSLLSGLSANNALPNNTTGSIFANLPGNGALAFANPSTNVSASTLASQGGSSSSLLAGLDQFLASIGPQVNFFAQNRTGAMGSPTTAMGALANLPAVAPAAQTAVAPVAQQSGVVIPPDLLAQLLGSRVANNNSNTEDTSVTQALEAKIEKLEDQIKFANGASSTTIAQQLEVLKTQLAQIKANTVQAKTTPPQATLQARLKELETQIATLKKAPITATTPVAKAPGKAGVTKA